VSGKKDICLDIKVKKLSLRPLFFSYPKQRNFYKKDEADFNLSSGHFEHGHIVQQL
jgi:hypothetical protein